MSSSGRDTLTAGATPRNAAAAAPMNSHLTGPQDTPVVALRSTDPRVIEQVRAICELVQAPVLVCPLGAPPPAAGLLLDSQQERATDHPAWGPAAMAVRVGTPGTGRPAGSDHGGSEHGSTSPVLVLPAQGEDLVRLIRAAARVRRARVVGVVGARGGVGASSLAAVLARAVAAERVRTALVDLDSVGAGLDLLLGVEDAAGVRWADLAEPSGDYDSAELAAALPSWRDVRVLSADWRGGVHAPAGSAVLEALWADLDVLVLDIARHHGWHQWANLCDLVVLLAGCDVISAAGVQTSRRAVGTCPVHLVVRGPAPGGLTAAEVAQACDLPLAAQMRPERSLSAAVERGVAPGDHSRGPLMRTGRALARSLGLVDPGADR